MALGFVLGGLQGVRADDALVIASEGARPPYNFLDANNELAGFEIDLGRALCLRLHRPCRFVTQDWDGLIPGLLAHQYDAVMAALEINDERRAKIAFSLPYARVPASFVVRQDAPDVAIAPASFAGKTIGVVEQSSAQALLDDTYKDAKPKTFASLEEAMLDLAEGRLDAVLADRMEVTDFLKTRHEGQCCRILGDAPRDVAIFGEGIGIGLRQGDVALRESIDAALQAMIDDGTFTRIRSPYFDFPIR